MAWVEVHQSLRDHRKIFALATELGMPEPHVVGHCVYLWLWALDNTEDGVIAVPERVLERVAGWFGEPGVLVTALVRVGLLDRRDDRKLVLHDWMVYGGKLTERRRVDAERKRHDRASRKTKGASSGRPSDVRRMSAGTEQNRRVQNNKSIARDADASTRALSTDDSPSPAPSTKRVDPLWDAMAEVMHCSPETEPERKSWNAALKFLRRADATAEQIVVRAQRYSDKYDHDRLTPHALVKHWGEMAQDPPPSHTASQSKNGHNSTTQDVNISAIPKGSVDWDALRAAKAGNA